MKNKIFGIVAILVVLSLIGWQYYKYQHPEAVAETNTEQTTTSGGSTSTSVKLEPPKNAVEVSSPARPVNGTKKGVIEVGASGFNAFVVTVDNQKNWELDFKEFGASFATEGLATKDDIVTGMKQYLTKIFNRGVSGKNIHFVMSSGALKNPKLKEIKEAISQMGYVVNGVTAEQEGKYALRATLPPQYKENSYVVDIGSGNTKISWYEGAALKTVESPGAKYYQNNTSDESVYNTIKDLVSKVPNDKRTRCFIIGGVPFTLAKESRQQETDRFTILAAPDDYSAGDDVKKKSGLNIYKALVDGTGTSTFVFDWDANFTIGFLLNLN